MCGTLVEGHPLKCVFLRCCWMNEWEERMNALNYHKHLWLCVLCGVLGVSSLHINYTGKCGSISNSISQSWCHIPGSVLLAVISAWFHSHYCGSVVPSWIQWEGHFFLSTMCTIGILLLLFIIVLQDYHLLLQTLCLLRHGHIFLLGCMYMCASKCL